MEILVDLSRVSVSSSLSLRNTGAQQFNKMAEEVIIFSLIYGMMEKFHSAKTVESFK